MSKELDQYIRRLVREVPSVIEDIIEHKDIGHTHVYYSGEWQQDVFDNFQQINNPRSGGMFLTHYFLHKHR